MADPNERPALLRDASTAIAYQRWLEANGQEDSDLNAWRFAALATPAESAAADPHSEPTPALGQSDKRRRGRWWVPVSIVAAVLLVFAGVVAYAVASAERWTKVDQEEVAHYIQVPDGTWHVTHEDKDICFVGQSYWACIDEYTDEWNFACAGRVHDAISRTICDNYYDMIQKMKNDAAANEFSEVSGLVQSGLLSISENTKRERVIDQPELSHKAICYLGFIGECPEKDEREHPRDDTT